MVTRQALLKWFSVHRTEPVLGLFAPAGYGKTTLLAQAAEADDRPVGWLSLEDRLNDPAELTRHLAEVFDRTGAVARDLPEAQPLPLSEVSSIASRPTAFTSIERRAVLVLDDVDVLVEPDCLNIIAALCAAVPTGSQLMLAGRREPDIGLALMRTERRVAELGPDDLSFDAIEAEALLRAAGVDLAGVDVVELTRRTEGWAAGLYLTALAMRRQRAGAVDVDPARG